MFPPSGTKVLAFGLFSFYDTCEKLRTGYLSIFLKKNTILYGKISAHFLVFIKDALLTLITPFEVLIVIVFGGNFGLRCSWQVSTS
jgi:hypothetical protein